MAQNLEGRKVVADAAIVIFESLDPDDEELGEEIQRALSHGTEHLKSLAAVSVALGPELWNPQQAVCEDFSAYMMAALCVGFSTLRDVMDEEVDLSSVDEGMFKQMASQTMRNYGEQFELKAWELFCSLYPKA